MNVRVFFEPTKDTKLHVPQPLLNPVAVGCGAPAGHVPLPGNFAPQQAARIFYDPDYRRGWGFMALCNEWQVKDGSRWRSLRAKDCVPVEHKLVVRIAPYYGVEISLDPDEEDYEARRLRAMAAAHNELVDLLHVRLVEEIPHFAPAAPAADGKPAKKSKAARTAQADTVRLTVGYLHPLELKIHELADQCKELKEDGVADYVAGVAARSRLLQELLGESEDAAGVKRPEWQHMSNRQPEAEAEITTRVRELARSIIGLAEDDAAARVRNRHLLEVVPDWPTAGPEARAAAEAAADADPEVRAEASAAAAAAAADRTARTVAVRDHFWRLWPRTIALLKPTTRKYAWQFQLTKEVKEYFYGLGPLEDLLVDPKVTEVMVNDADHIFIEKDKTIENSGRRFVSEKRLFETVQRIVNKVGRTVDISKPIVDAWLEDGSRVNAVIPPITGKGTCLTIRRFPAKPLDIKELLAPKPTPRNPHPLASLSADAAAFLKAAVVNRRNVLVSGGTGTGKTTLLNCLSEFIPDKERIVTVEDTAELRLVKEHVVSLLTRPNNMEGKGEVTIRSLVKNALRMRPDRIVVGECRGGEAIDMLQAMNTGHDGSLTTIHANNPADVILRLEVMVQQNPDIRLPVESIHRQIVSAVDLIVQLAVVTERSPVDPAAVVKHRVVSEIAEVTDYDPDAGVRLRTLFQRHGAGTLEPTGRLPSFIRELVNDKLLPLHAFLGGPRAAAGGA